MEGNDKLFSVNIREYLALENDEEKLLSFYQNNRFSQFDTRQIIYAASDIHVMGRNKEIVCRQIREIAGLYSHMKKI